MSNENTTSEAPNGTSNGMPNGDPKTAEAAVSAQHKEDETAPHRRKTRGRRDKAPAPPSTPTAASELPVEVAVTSSEPEEATAVEEVASSPQKSSEAPPTPSQDADTAAIAPENTETLADAAGGDLRLRMKVWTDQGTGKRYLMPAAFMRDVVNGRPISDVMLAYAMRDDDTRIVTLRAHEWNTLPFSYFEEDGPAPRATAQPIDVLGGRSTR